MNGVVLDASVTLALVYPDPYTAKALAFVTDLARERRRMFGPPLLPVEMTNLIRKRMRADRMTLARGTQLLDDFLEYPITILSPERLHHRALALTEAHSLGGHDAHYVALAELLACDLWTGDARIIRAVGGRLPFVRFIGDYTTPNGTAATSR